MQHSVMSFSATALITGGSSGLGYSTVRFIAQQRPNWRVLIVSRDGLQAADRLNSELKETGHQPNVFFLPLDCSSKQAVRQFAQDYSNANHPPIKALLINAGLQVVSGVKYSEDGYEMTMATNHIGQALLLFLLQPHLTDDAHIIYTGSGLHKKAIYISAEECAHPGKDNKETSTSAGQRRYALSKLVNALWMYALREKVSEQKKNWTVAAFGPGLMPGTGLARDSPFLLRLLWVYILPQFISLIRKVIPETYTPDESGRVLAKLAIEKGLVTSDDTSAYWQHNGADRPGDNCFDLKAQQDLWSWTVGAVAQDESERERFNTLQ